MSPHIVLACLLACLALAGCASGPEATTSTSTSTSSSATSTSTAPGPVPSAPYTLTATGMPTSVRAGENFTFHLKVEGGVPRTSDHIGGHFWSTSTSDPTADFGSQAGACVHVSGGGALPGEYDITCKFASAGTFYLHGHARYVDGALTRNDWTASHSITAT